MHTLVTVIKLVMVSVNIVCPVVCFYSTLLGRQTENQSAGI